MPIEVKELHIKVVVRGKSSQLPIRLLSAGQASVPGSILFADAKALARGLRKRGVPKSWAGVVVAAEGQCSLPRSPSPMPIPFPNIAMDPAAGKSDKTVTSRMDGRLAEVQRALRHAGFGSTSVAFSLGDEAGTAGGVTSSKHKGKVYFQTYAMDVKSENKHAHRMSDIQTHNQQSAGTTPGGFPIAKPSQIKVIIY